jgi:anti-sigma B factor antagonist
MSAKPEMIHVEREGDVLIVMPMGPMGELEYEECEAEVEAVLKRSESPGVRDVLFDLGRVELFGSSAVGWFIEISHRVVSRGRVALCRVSEMGKEVLKATNLEGHWPIYDSRSEALAALRERGG